MHALQFEELIDSNKITINGLEKFKGKKVEITIDIKEDSNPVLENKIKAFEIIDNYSGQIKKWTREEIYDR